MSRARVIRTYTFTARHRYGRADWSDVRNAEVYGEQMKSHVHDWRLEVRISGEIDRETGFLVDLGALDRLVAHATEGWDGGDLNRVVPEVASGEVVPSTESLARLLFERLAPHVPGDAVLESLALFESDELGAEYPAGGSA